MRRPRTDAEKRREADARKVVRPFEVSCVSPGPRCPCGGVAAYEWTEPAAGKVHEYCAGHAPDIVGMRAIVPIMRRAHATTLIVHAASAQAANATAIAAGYTAPVAKPFEPIPYVVVENYSKARP